MEQTTITDIRTVGVPVRDQDRALTFFVDTLGFEKRLDARVGDSFRWVTVAAPGGSTSVALIANPATGADTGIRFVVPDAEVEYAAMRRVRAAPRRGHLGRKAALTPALSQREGLGQPSQKAFVMSV